MTNNYDLIKYVRTSEHSDEEESNYSESSDEENDSDDSSIELDSDFVFDVGSDNHNDDRTNRWDDMNKYMNEGKAKSKFNIDDKIKKVRQRRRCENETEDDLIKPEIDNDTKSVSEDEIEEDTFRIIENKHKKKAIEESDEEKIDFEDTENSEYTKPQRYTTFLEMNLSKPLLKAITKMNFVQPTPIQWATLSAALAGRDIYGCAATGTGKTAAYMIPTLERLIHKPKGPVVSRILVLLPTRELALQVYEVTKQLTQFTTLEVGLSVGGLGIKKQKSILRKNPDIIIATPGRLIDHSKNVPTFSLSNIEILILDEADRMLDEYFIDQVKYIVQQCPTSIIRQTMLFSATMTEEVANLVMVSLDKPVKIFVNSNQDMALNLRQEFIRIRKERNREAILAALICRSFHDRILVFVRTKMQAHRLHVLLGLLGLKVGELHGDLSQPQRLDNLQNFKDGTINILLATDVAARGLDISGVQTVINFIMPATLQHYVHRVGRTARAGREGVSVSLYGEEDRSLMKIVMKNTTNITVRRRSIAYDIIEKYNKKLQSLEPDVEQILEDERNAKKLSEVEENLRLTEKQVGKNKKDEQIPSNIIKDRKKNKQKNSRLQETAEDRALQRLIDYNIRAVKRKRRNKPMTAMDHQIRLAKRKSLKRPRSAFADLTDTDVDTRKNVKRMRYETNVKKKQNIPKIHKGKSATRKNRKGWVKGY